MYPGLPSTYAQILPNWPFLMDEKAEMCQSWTIKLVGIDTQTQIG